MPERYYYCTFYSSHVGGSYKNTNLRYLHMYLHQKVVLSVTLCPCGDFKTPQLPWDKQVTDSEHWFNIRLETPPQKNTPEEYGSGRRCQWTRISRLEEDRLHLDKGEVIVLRQALVADTAKSVPGEWRESVLCRGPVYRFCSELPSHEKVSHLCEK